MKTPIPTHSQTPQNHRACRYLPLLRAGLLVAISAATPALLRAEVTGKADYNFTLSAGGSLSLENMNGSARFASSPATNGEVHVQAIKHGATEADLKSTEIEIRSDPASLHIKTHFGKGDTHHSINASVDYMITVPAGVRLDGVNLTNGDLTLNGLTLAALHASCTNGGLVAQDLNSTGSIKLENVNGKVDIGLLSLPATETVEVSDVNGEIHLTIPSGANAAVRASTVNGGIKTNTGLKSREESFTGQKLEGRLGAGTTSIRLQTTNGEIRFDQAPAR